MKHTTSLVLALATGVALAVLVVACGASQKSTFAAPPSADAAGPLGPRPDEIKAEIEALDKEIQDSLAGAQVDRATYDPPTAMAGQALPPPDLRPLGEIRDVCVSTAPPPSSACGQVCTLGNKICDNAERICNLADKLPGDPWARDRCQSGKRSCEAGRKRCCECK
jgi:hypothetical protein